MGSKYFGTDGIRGCANTPPMTSELALRVGMAAGRIFTRGDHRHRVVIGKDTRLSGYMIESAMVAGFTSVGMDVFLLGPMPTPAVAMLTRSLRADIGVMISASHNQYHDNGIKLFGPDGYKLSDEHEARIEALIDDGFEQGLAAPDALGRAKRIDDAPGALHRVRQAHIDPPCCVRRAACRRRLCQGAAYRVAPAVLWELGAEVIKVGVEPDGFNINATAAPRRCLTFSPRFASSEPMSAWRLMVMPIVSSWWTNTVRSLTAIRSWRYWPRPGPRTIASRRRHRGDGDVQSRARAPSRRPGAAS